MTAPTKLQRWLDVIAFLASRRFPVTVEELWAAVPAYAHGVDADARTHAAVRRTFERDKDELKALGVPIESVTFTINYNREEVSGYRLRTRDFHLPYVRLLRDAADGAAPRPASGAERPGEGFELSASEAAAALDGLRHVAEVPSFPLAREAKSAFRKIAFDLDHDLIAGPAVHHVSDAETERSAEALRRLSGAMLARKTVRFGYRNITRDTREERTAQPYGLLFHHGRWYLVGHDEDRGAPRMYRVGRMHDVTPNAKAPRTPDFEVPADFALEAYAGRSAWELGDDGEDAVTATVRFTFPRSLWAERNGHGRLIEELDDGAQIRSFDVHRRDPFLRWLLSLGGDAAVEEPAELRDAFRALAAEVAERHRVRA